MGEEVKTENEIKELFLTKMKEKNLKLSRLCTQAGVDKGNGWRFFHSNRKNPNRLSFSAVAKFAKALDIPLSELG